MTKFGNTPRGIALWVSGALMFDAVGLGLLAAFSPPAAEAPKPRAVVSSPAPTTKPPATHSASPSPSHSEKPKPKPKPTHKPVKPSKTATKAPPEIVFYANCSEVRAAGAAPIYEGQPGYSSDLDRDGDGVACE